LSSRAITGLMPNERVPVTHKVAGKLEFSILHLSAIPTFSPADRA
jgi:hypothetical protein